MSLKSLQAKIGVTADGAFGPGTMKAAMAFYKLTPKEQHTSLHRLLTRLENINYLAKT
jgi:murein L,D-transpeptidase YcbB/YkuD